jgi:hypothetical protein
MKKLRRVTEADVIAGFLKAEYFQNDYDFDRDLFTGIVNQPDLTNEAENALRRALLFRRRGKMWWELPDDRQWWEVEFEPQDVDRVSVFPRAHWIKLARGNFQARHVVERVRQQMQADANEGFSAKMAAIHSTMKAGRPSGLIIFLGVDETQRLALLEGNHRFIASLLAPDRELLGTARLVVGFSPNMDKCCWYKTSFQTLFRCLKNRIQHSWDRDADVAGLLEQLALARSGAGLVERPDPANSKIVSQ